MPQDPSATASAPQFPSPEQDHMSRLQAQGALELGLRLVFVTAAPEWKIDNLNISVPPQPRKMPCEIGSLPRIAATAACA